MIEVLGATQAQTRSRRGASPAAKSRSGAPLRLGARVIGARQPLEHGQGRPPVAQGQFPGAFDGAADEHGGGHHRAEAHPPAHVAGHDPAAAAYQRRAQLRTGQCSAGQQLGGRRRQLGQVQAGCLSAEGGLAAAGQGGSDQPTQPPVVVGAHQVLRPAQQGGPYEGPVGEAVGQIGLGEAGEPRPQAEVGGVARLGL